MGPVVVLPLVIFIAINIAVFLLGYTWQRGKDWGDE